MIWLVQQSQEWGYESLLAAIDSTGDRRILLSLEGWESTISRKLSDTHPFSIFPFGTRNLIRYAIQHDWTVHWDDSYSYSTLLRLGDQFINHDMCVAPITELVVPDDQKVFIREETGYNIIKGKVINGYAWPQWVNGFLNGPDSSQTHDWHPITKESLFVWAPAKTIVDEYRVWIIGGKVVSASRYIQNGEIKYTNADGNEQVCAYAQEIADSFDFGMSCYVLDLFQTAAGLKVGELNCLHCSGYYAVDMLKVVKSLREYHGNNEH